MTRASKPRRTHRALVARDQATAIGVREFCARLDISERQFYRWKRHGCLPVQPLRLPGSVIRFSPAQVDAFVQGRSR